MQLRSEAAQYAQQRLAQVEATRALSCGFVRFLQGNVFGHPQVQSLGPFDRIFVGADAPKTRLRNLLRLLKRGESSAMRSASTAKGLAKRALKHSRIL